MKENRGAVLRAPIGPLAVDLRGIVVLPENFQQIVVRDFRGIVFHFDRFGVAGAIGANFFIGGVLGLATGVADASGGDARHLPEGGFHAPETSRCECGFFHWNDCSLTCE